MAETGISTRIYELVSSLRSEFYTYNPNPLLTQKESEELYSIVWDSVGRGDIVEGCRMEGIDGVG